MTPFSFQLSLGEVHAWHSKWLCVFGRLRGLFKNMRTVWIARLELVSGESAWCRWVRTDQLTKTQFSSRKYLHLLISYTVLNRECFFRLSDWKRDCLKEQRIAVKFCVKPVMNNGFMVMMTLKRRSNHRNGWVKLPQDPKKLAKFDRMSRWC